MYYGNSTNLEDGHFSSTCDLPFGLMRWRERSKRPWWPWFDLMRIRNVTQEMSSKSKLSLVRLLTCVTSNSARWCRLNDSHIKCSDVAGACIQRPFLNRPQWHWRWRSDVEFALRLNIDTLNEALNQSEWRRMPVRKETLKPPFKASIVLRKWRFVKWRSLI